MYIENDAVSFLLPSSKFQSHILPHIQFQRLHFYFPKMAAHSLSKLPTSTTALIPNHRTKPGLDSPPLTRNLRHDGLQKPWLGANSLSLQSSSLRVRTQEPKLRPFSATVCLSLPTAWVPFSHFSKSLFLEFSILFLFHVLDDQAVVSDASDLVITEMRKEFHSLRKCPSECLFNTFCRLSVFYFWVCWDWGFGIGWVDADGLGGL